MTSIAFFDVDKTLLKGYSGFYTTLLLIQRGILKKRRLPLSLFYLLISPLYKGNVQRMYETAAQDMAGRSIEDILDIGRECFKKWIQPRLYREGIAAVQKHQERGDPVYLMTSGPYMTIRILADYLGVNGDYSSGPVIENGILTEKVRMPVCYREGKVFAASDVVKKYQVDWKDCYYYADSTDDLPLLEKVGHPHVVNPEGKLLKIGRKKGWPLLHFEHTLGSL